MADLPGIYSLEAASPDEKAARAFLEKERPDVILNIIDATNLERNLYLTTQLLELGIPLVLALNVMDMVEKKGDRIDIPRFPKSSAVRWFRWLLPRERESGRRRRPL